MTVRVIALGNVHARDDGAARRAVRRLQGVDVIEAGRPGPGLLDLLEGPTPVVLVDVVRGAGPAGRIVTAGLHELPDLARAMPQYSSHGFGPAETLELGRALGRTLPPGTFVGIEGADFGPGDALSPEVGAALEPLIAAVRSAAEQWEKDACTKAG